MLKQFVRSHANIFIYLFFFLSMYIKYIVNGKFPRYCGKNGIIVGMLKTPGHTIIECLVINCIIIFLFT